MKYRNCKLYELRNTFNIRIYIREKKKKKWLINQ